MDNLEIRNCEHGEVNKITKEIFCNRYNDFCKFIVDCPIKTCSTRLKALWESLTDKQQKDGN
jgi:hypothetical protein